MSLGYFARAALSPSINHNRPSFSLGSEQEGREVDGMEGSRVEGNGYVIQHISSAIVCPAFDAALRWTAGLEGSR